VKVPRPVRNRGSSRRLMALPTRRSTVPVAMCSSFSRPRGPAPDRQRRVCPQASSPPTAPP
jgi:hypothetical protein